MPKAPVSEEVQVLRFFEEAPIEKAEMLFNIVKEKMRSRMAENPHSPERVPKKKERGGALVFYAQTPARDRGIYRQAGARRRRACFRSRRRQSQPRRKSRVRPLHKAHGKLPCDRPGDRHHPAPGCNPGNVENRTRRGRVADRHLRREGALAASE